MEGRLRKQLREWLYDIKRKVENQIEDRLRKITEACDNIQAFVFNHSVQGGTGSSFSTYLLQNIATNYSKKAKINFIIYPSPSFSSVVVGPYNAMFSLSRLLQHSDLTVPIDNQSLYRVFKQGLDFDFPSFCNINKLISQVQSSFTLPMRYKDCKLNCSVSQILTNLVAYPRIHFAFPSYSPINLNCQNQYSQKGMQNLVSGAFDRKNELLTSFNEDRQQQSYSQIISSTLLLRGDINQMQVYKSMDKVKRQQLRIAEWSPRPIKIGIHHKKAISFYQGQSKQKVKRSACSFTSSFKFHSIFEKINHKFDLIYAKRAFVHWYVGYGMEEAQFSQARQDMAALQKDYEVWEGCCQQYDEEQEYPE